MRYELATFSVRLGAMPAAMQGIESFTKAPEAKGALLGVFVSEIGRLNQVTVLRGFEDEAVLFAERARTLASANPFHCGEALSGLSLEAYRPFPFLPPVRPGKYGAVYEIRTYLLKPGGEAPTIAAWEAAIPAREKLSPLTVAMMALDGPPRFTHLWPYASLEARAAIRAESVAQGIWPPKGGPAWLTGDMSSTIALPAAISPLA